MAGLWGNKGVPTKGWINVDMEDLGAPEGQCEMCGREEIRYVHVMEHPNYPDAVSAGCICAEHMASDYSAGGKPSEAKQRENALKNAASRRRRWPELKSWKASKKGNPHVSRGGFHITVFCQDGAYKFRLEHPRLAKTYFSRRTYADEMAAKLGAFDSMTFLQGRGLA